ncbi:hypothetical protein [Haemophilus parahaemolyticus]|uniref:hypothetical protein n=1 Tax=Haemophilus parahaemolyticus TaxID=735 RepID=UPI0028E5A293|nr:hypothetical protein [Haemophilus parahaemolyticus]
MSSNKNPQNDAQLLAEMREMLKVHKQINSSKEKELQVEQERIKSNEKIALASIQAQKEDRLAQMDLFSRFQVIKYVFGGVISVGVFVLVWYAMKTNNTEFAIELAKMLIPLIVGLIGGYGLGRHKSNNENNSKEDD